MRHLIATLAFASVAVFGVGSAHAQCTKDTDCKGDRVCNNGQCVDVTLQPSHAQPPAAVSTVPPPPTMSPTQPVIVQPPPAAVPAQPVQVIVNNGPQAPQAVQPMRLQEPQLGRKPPGGGWAIGAGVTGLVFGVIVVGLAGASESTKVDKIPSLPLGITALVLTIAMCPVTASGGSSARAGTDLHGVVPLRVFAWLFYGLAIGGGVLTAVLGAADHRPPDGLIIGIGGLAGLSFLFLSIDDFVSFAQNRGLAERYERGMTSSLELAHYLSPFLTPDGKVGGSVGLVGRF